MPPSPVRILLVEDSRVQREMIRSVLVRLGYEVHLAASGEEAVAQYGREDFDVLLVDVVLPGIGGIDVLSRVRKSNPQQCVILMTAEGSGLSAMGAIRAGADDYVTKPIRLDDDGAELEVIISRSVERRRLARENLELQQKLIEANRLNAVMALAGAAAHEMNQPLTVIIGLTELLLARAQERGEEVPDYETLLRSARRLSDIVRKLSNITGYHVKDYVDGVSILDLDRSSEKPE